MCLAVPGEILDIADAEPLVRTAVVSFGGLRKTVSLALLPEAQQGQFVLVHAGVAIGIVDEDEAARIFGYLEEIGELEELREDAP